MSYNYTFNNSGVYTNTSTNISTSTATGTFTLPTTNYIFQSYQSSYQSSYIIEYKDSSGKPIVTLENDGSVTWHDTNKFGEAEKMFSDMIVVSAENAAKITERVKSEIFDQVFEEIYQVFMNKESIIAYESSKIFRKLRGPR